MTYTPLTPTDNVPPTEPVRKRPAPGERRVQILQTLAAMLQEPTSESVTTAALAARLDVSEAALYRHFASKAQMFEGLIEFIESSVFGLINQIQARYADAPNGRQQAGQVVAILLQFAEKNPGMARVMVGDALVRENVRLQQRMNLFFDKVESALKQVLQVDAQQTPAEAALAAGVLVAFASGKLQRFVRSGFRHLPSEAADAGLALLLRAID
jgi:TetR/AcrR family transcriptional regulator